MKAGLPFGFDGPLVLSTSLIVKDLKVDELSSIGKAGHDGVVCREKVAISVRDWKGVTRMALVSSWYAIMTYWFMLLERAGNCAVLTG